MSIFTPLRNRMLGRRSSVSSRANKQRRQRLRTQPALEALEDRTVPSAITGSLVEDLNGDGDLTDAQALNLDGVTIFLDQNQNGLRDSGEASTTTASDGTYGFTGLADGTYHVTQQVLPGWMQTSPGPAAGPDLLGDVMNRFAAPDLGPNGVVSINGSLYTHDWDSHTLYQLDPTDGSVQFQFDAPEGSEFVDITHDGEHFWGADDNNGQLVRFDYDPQNGTTLVYQTFTHETVSRPRGITWDGSHLWVADQATEAIVQINPADGSVGNNTISGSLPSETFRALGFDDEHLWVQLDQTHEIHLDPNNFGEVRRSFDFASLAERPLATGVAYDGQSLWITQFNDSQIIQIDVNLPRSQVVTISGGNNVSDVDFGNFELGKISGRVFDDADGNATQATDGSEAGLEGWRVYIDHNGNGQFDWLEQSVLSDANGYYELTNLRPGELANSLLRSPGWTATTGSTSNTVTKSGDALTRDFGYQLTGEIFVDGPETLINTTTEGTQQTFNPEFKTDGPVDAVASDGSGNTVVVWTGNGNGDDVGTFSQRYDSNGLPVGTETRVNTTTDGGQYDPMVARAADTGIYAVAWDNGATLSNGSVYGRVYNPDGTARSQELLLAETARGGQTSFSTESIAMDASGGFVVLYEQVDWKGNESTHSWGFKRFDSYGQELGNPTIVAELATDNGDASMGMDADGNFVVVWDELGDGNVYAQRYDSNGLAVGSQIQVGSGTTPYVEMDTSGNFVVTWIPPEPDTGPHERKGQIFNADGSRHVTSFSFGSVSGVGPIPSSSPSFAPAPVAIQADGDLVIAWAEQDSQQFDLFAQQFDANGNAKQSPFRVNTTIAGDQEFPSLASDSAGNVLIVWNGNGVGDDLGVFGQRYSSAPNTSPIAEANGDYSGTEDVAITFDATGSSDPDGDTLSYTWDFGDGTTLTTSNPTIDYTYKWGGIFTVTLTADDGKGGTATDTATATVAEVNDAPVADAGGPYTGVEGEAITFDASGSFDDDNLDGTTANDQTLSYTWDFGDGNTLTTNSTTIDHIYSVAATYEVILTVSDGTDSHTVSTTASVTEAPSGSANDMYVWDITYETRIRGGGKFRDVLIDTTVRSDSDADGITESADDTVANASVTLELWQDGGDGSFGTADDIQIGTFSGTTDDQGVFSTGWIKDLSDGIYWAEVTELTHDSLTWNSALDPTENDADSNNNGLPDQQFVLGDALMAESIGTHADGQQLTITQVQSLVDEAISRFAVAGFDVSALDDVQFQIIDLDGATLGMNVDNTIFIDINAAGWGWFVDDTPWEDSEFTTPGNQGEMNRIDLLTVLMHEMGHMLNLEHDDGLMNETLATGVRYSPDSDSEHEETDALFAALAGHGAWLEERDSHARRR